MEENEMNQQDAERDIVDFEGEDGSIVSLELDRYFFYNGEEYAVFMDQDSEDEDEVGCYIMKVTTEVKDGVEEEVFVPIEDEELEDRLFDVAMTQYNDDEEIDE